MVSPIENGRRLPTRKNLLVKGVMVVGGAATALTAVGGLRTPRVDAQGPTPTPAATDIAPRPTDAINPVEPTPTPEPNQVLLKNPTTGECVLVVFPNQAINPDLNPTPTPAADGQPVSAIAEPTSGPTSTPELIAQAPGVDVAPLLQAQEDPTTWEPCAEGEEPTATMTAEPTVAPTEEPTATPTLPPTAEPTTEPIATPTAQPTQEPTPRPTAAPTSAPSNPPSNNPSPEVTQAPQPVTVEDWLDGDYPNKEGAIINDWIEELYAADPEAAQATWFGVPYQQKISSAWKDCRDGVNEGGGRDLARKISCTVAAGGIYKGFYNKDSKVVKLAKKAFSGVVGYAQDVLPTPFKKDLIKDIKDNF